MGLNLLDFCKFVNSFFLTKIQTDTCQTFDCNIAWAFFKLKVISPFICILKKLFHCCWRNQVDNLSYRISHILDLAYFFPMVSFYHDRYILIIRCRGLIRSGIRSGPSLSPLPPRTFYSIIFRRHICVMFGCLSLWSYDWWGGLGIISLIHYKIPYRLFPQ